jgi:hypothetical protein
MFRTPMRLDRINRVLTVVVCAIVVAALAALLKAPGLGAARAVLIAFPLVVLALAWAMSPSALVVEAGELRVERRAWRPLRVPLASIADASLLDGIGRNSIRVFGVGGFFGSYGLFWNKVLGRFRLYATRTGQAIVVRRTGDAIPIVLTPDDVAGAVRAIQPRAAFER